MSVAGPAQAVPTPDVLPSGVRRRLGARDAWLAGVLTAELLAGAGLGAGWEARADLGRLVLPAAPAAVVVADSGAARGARTATTWVVVPPPPSPPAPAPPPRRTVPRSPFEVQAG